MTNVEIQRFCQNKHQFNGNSSRSKISTVKDGAYVTNLSKYVALLFMIKTIKYYILIDFALKIFPRKFKRSINNTGIFANIYRIQANESIMRGYFCIGFNNYVLNNKISIDFTNVFSQIN